MTRSSLVTDRRTYKDRRDVWAADKPKSDFVAERPKAKIKQVADSEGDAPAHKPKRAPARQKVEEGPEELVSRTISARLRNLLSS